MPAEGRALVLVGMTGSGKTTTGRLLARRLGWRHADADDLVAEESGTTVADLWAGQGEAAFRRAERAAIERALADRAPLVLSVGGGAVGDAGTRRLLRRSATVVWLRADDATLVGRLQGAELAARPVLQGDPAGRVPVMAAERRPWFEEVADAVVDVDGLAPDDVADRVLAAVGRAGAAPPPGAAP